MICRDLEKNFVEKWKLLKNMVITILSSPPVKAIEHGFDLVGWLVGLCFTSHRQRGHLETAPHLLSHAKDEKLGFYTVPTGNRTSVRRVAVHYTTAAPRQLPTRL